MTLEQVRLNAKSIRTRVEASTVSFAIILILFLIFAVPELISRSVFTDESFLFRTGFIQFFLKDLIPQNVTPVTFLVGICLRVGISLTFLLYSCRFLNLFILIYVIWNVPRRVTNSPWSSSLFFILILLHPSIFFFLTHARYDTSIFIISFLFLPLFIQRREFGKRSVLYSAVLLTSTLKGVFYFSVVGFSLLLISILQKQSRPNKKELLLFSFLLFLVTSVIIAVFAIFGVLPQFVTTISSQFSLLEGLSPNRAALLYLIQENISRGFFFYLIFFLALIFAFKKSDFSGQSRSVLIYAGLLIFFGWIYVFRHPVAFSPMSIAADMSAGLLATMWLCRNSHSVRKNSLFWLFLSLGFLVQLQTNRYFYLFNSNNKIVGMPAHDYLRIQNIDFAKSDKIFDPTGAIYWAKPCSNEWYIDATYQAKQKLGNWMQNVDWKNCQYAIYSTQFSALDLPAQNELLLNYSFQDYPLLKRRADSK